MKHISEILKPIETRYAGRLFRSRLEARWAVFFDALGIRWDYEREGYELNGIRFLPDFWLEHVTLRSETVSGVWVEIKPTMDALKENESKFWILDKPLIVFVGNPPGDLGSGYQYANEDQGGFWDGGMRIMKCVNSDCEHVKIDYLNFHTLKCTMSQAHRVNWNNHESVSKALSARFEG